MKFQILFRRLFDRNPFLKTRAAGLIGTLGVFGVLGAVIGGVDDSERRIRVEREAFDFRQASVLGTPERLVLDGRERRFSKAREETEARDTAIRSEIANLREEVARLKGGGAPLPEPSPSVAAVMKSEPMPDAPPVAAVTEPTPLPEASPRVHALGAVQEAERRAWQGPSGVVDEIRVHKSAPSFGFEAPPARKGSQGRQTVSFPVKAKPDALRAPSVLLPTGSYVKGKLLTGVEAPEGRSYPALLALDFAYVIPNENRLDLSGCFMIAKAQGDLSTERVQMQAVRLSCVSKRGGFFEREVNGFVADEVDNSFAVIGSVNSKQDRVAAMAFLSSIVQGVGRAIQSAQTTQQSTPLGGSQSIVTGDQAKYIAAGGASEAASKVADWYLKQAENLLPTINVGSGQTIWVVMQESVDLPRDYFVSTPGGNANASIYTHLTRLVD